MSEAYRIDWKEELIDGKVVAMSPASVNHVLIAGNIFHIFKNYLKGKKCIPIMDGALVYLTEEDHFIPDMMVVCDPDKIKTDGVHGAPDLVVEILSPSTAWNDKTHKKDIQAMCGVQEYWIVSPSERFVEVYYNVRNEFVLHKIYPVYSDWMLEKMNEADRKAVETHFKCSLYDDFDIYLDDIFGGLV